jgi:hypothetical protein
MPQPWPAVSADQTKRMVCRRGPEAAGDWLAHQFAVGEIDHRDAVMDPLAGRQTGELELGGEIGLLEGCGTAQRLGIGEALGRRPFDHQAGRPVGPRPEDRAVPGQIPGLDPVGQARPHALAGDHRRGRGLRERARRQHRAGDESAAGLRRMAQESAPAEGENRSDPRHGALPQHDRSSATDRGGLGAVVRRSCERRVPESAQRAFRHHRS